MKNITLSFKKRLDLIKKKELALTEEKSKLFKDLYDLTETLENESLSRSYLLDIYGELIVHDLDGNRFVKDEMVNYSYLVSNIARL